jgi:hypothetical protein
MKVREGDSNITHRDKSGPLGHQMPKTKSLVPSRRMNYKQHWSRVFAPPQFGALCYMELWIIG